MRQGFPDAVAMVVVTDHGNNTYDVKRHGWTGSRVLTAITNINPDIVGQIQVDDTVLVGAYNGDPQQWAILDRAGFMGSPDATDFTPAASPAILALLDWPRHGRDENCQRDTGEETLLWDVTMLGVQNHTHPSSGGGPVGLARMVTGLVWFWQRRDSIWCLVAGSHNIASPGSSPSYTVAAQLPADPFSGTIGPVCMVMETAPNSEATDPLYCYTSWVSGDNDNPLAELPLEPYEDWTSPRYLTKVTITGEGYSHDWSCSLPGIPLGSCFLAEEFRWQVVGTWDAELIAWTGLSICKINETTGALLATRELPLGTPTVAWDNGAALQSDAWDMDGSTLPWSLEGGQRGQDYERGWGRVRYGGYLRDFAVIRRTAQDTNSRTYLVPIWSYAEQMPVWRISAASAVVDRANYGWTVPGEYTVFTTILAQSGRLLYHWEKLAFATKTAITLGGGLVEFMTWEEGVRSNPLEVYDPVWDPTSLYSVYEEDLEAVIVSMFQTTVDNVNEFPESERFTSETASNVPTQHLHGWSAMVITGAESPGTYTVPAKTSTISHHIGPVTIELFTSPEVPAGVDPDTVIDGYIDDLPEGAIEIFNIEFVVFQETTNPEPQYNGWRFYHDANSLYPSLSVPGIGWSYDRLRNGPFTGILRRLFFTIRVSVVQDSFNFEEGYTVPWHSCNAAADEQGVAFSPRAHATLWPDPTENPTDDDPARPGLRPFGFLDWTMALRGAAEDDTWQTLLDGTEEEGVTTVFSVESISTPVIMGEADDEHQALVAVYGTLIQESWTEDEEPELITVETPQLHLWTQRPGENSAHSTTDEPDIEGVGSTYTDLMAVASPESERALLATGFKDKILSIVIASEAP